MNENHCKRSNYKDRSKRSSRFYYTQQLNAMKRRGDKHYPSGLSKVGDSESSSSGLGVLSAVQNKDENTTRIKLDPDNVEKGLAQLVLTVLELLRQLMERQAVRRMETGSLTDSQIERMGETFMKLEEKVTELREHFHLNKEDLNINLGPLGNLM